MQEEKGFTLITGATGGLGGAFARVLVGRGESVFLTGRSEEKLCKMKENLLRACPHTSVFYHACDLTSERDRQTLFDAMKRVTESENLPLFRLINVAGVDIQKAFLKYTQEKLLFQCRVNFESAVSLCLAGIELGVKEIINISSVSGIYPMPYFALYSATKGALTSFSVSLREEMKGTGVKVTAVLPGAIPTRDDVKEQIRGQGLWGKIAVKSPEFVAIKSLEAVKKNKAKVVVGFANKFMNASTRLIPASWKRKFIAKRWGKIEKDAF